MLYKLIYMFHTDYSFLNVFRYITFRTIYATLTALVISLVLGYWLIPRLRELQIGQYVRDDGPPNHKTKVGTPTMGGTFILISVVLSSLLWAEPKNVYIWLVLVVTVLFGAVGFVDDYLKIARKSSKGLRVWSKLCLQTGIALGIGLVLYYGTDFDTRLSFPFFKKFLPELGIGYLILIVLVVVGTSNAVNLTDGLDGLAIGPIIIAFLSYLVFAYLSGHIRIAQYIQIPYVSGSGELSVLCGAVAGAGLGFLWFNAFPAQVFMGDAGSLSMGAALGTIAVISKQEITLILVGGLFVVEASSVILQVAYFKLTGGRRVFRMAPLHHHFELKGWPEPKVTIRFWIIAIMLALLSVSTLKLR
ncbi:MAG TPA: phospho-N-acetylmuramoyl-pentapeptide-transferase [Desulfatiglandales bacterium]|nr:phospho-N-acetylmuramoyl-pentapeptide-transferase [Desulfatiglandales bacterium]